MRFRFRENASARVRPRRRRARPSEIVVLKAEQCSLCDKAVELIGIAAPEVPLRQVDVHSQEGRELARRHRDAFVPVVIVDGELVASGAIDDDALLDALGS